ncbi:hypothetical protein GDO78_015090 [Eleutherodactylus coqui]|uniref:Uncharacterized protein n=1 Tax=Eleutherodactylus coqui TaxID=57060 RepID=A0A8J6E8N3_ELECQ|nr:hypothetical protein GDO78_015090 [Eleutherodactylus coqui]
MTKRRRMRYLQFPRITALLTHLRALLWRKPRKKRMAALRLTKSVLVELMIVKMATLSVKAK